MLDNNLKEQIKAHLANLATNVVINANTDDSAKSKEMMSLLEDIASLSPKVILENVTDAALRVPAFTVTNAENTVHICFAGIPMGHEFTSFILAILQTGGYPPKVEPEVIAQIKALDQELNFVTYISLTCQNCPTVVQALNLMAVLNPKISSTMVDGTLYQDEVKQRNIMAVPTVYLNDVEFSSGRMTLQEILAKVDTKGAEREAEKISAKEPFDVLVIGGGSAAAASAIYAARKGIRTGLVTENFGGQILNTTDIENIIAIKKTEGLSLAAIYEDNIRTNGVDVMMPQRVNAISPGKMIQVSLESGATLESKTVILATGATCRKMGIANEEQYIGKGVAFCPHCDGPLYRGKDVAVIGGGNSAVEAAIDLAGICKHVTIMIRRDQFTADTVLQEKMLSLKNITIIKHAKLMSVVGDGSHVTGLDYTDQFTQENRYLKVDGIFVQIGQEPATDWLKASAIELNEKNEIVVDTYNRTSVPGIFAAGDATSSPYKQIVIALGDGAKAALSAFDYLIRQ